ncbi:MAG: hypothetical protein L0387_19635 [Acidobacteria bacterium]|nr:hypothetical protein [Acidobacteriota bacterium]MCI0721822.1 hypothetical protein [Acidobacteriota bacterium]
MSETEDVQLLKSSTIPPVRVTARGFQTNEEAKKVGETVGAVLWMIGSIINLERLEGVTVAYDYDEALTELDRGFESTAQLQRTRDDVAIGAAMAAPVMREGQVKAHLFIHGAIAEALQQQTEKGWRTAFYTLAHEAAHVEEFCRRDKAMPGVLLNLRLQHEQAVLYEIADMCWGEYAASRLSSFADPEQGKAYEETFCDVLRRTREGGNGNIRAYRMHGDTSQLLDEITEGYGSLSKYASYLLGHLAGEDQTLEKDAGNAWKVLEETQYFSDSMKTLNQIFDGMWRTRDTWTGFEVFEPLMKWVRDMLRIAGITLSMRGGMLYLDVPFSEATMP